MPRIALKQLAIKRPPAPRPLTVTDPETGQVWRIPPTPTHTLHADVRERWFLNVAIPEHLFRTIVPLPFLAPDRHNGAIILSLCRIAMRHGAPTWAPVQLGPACDNAALRVGCIDTRDGSHVVWVDERYTTHVLGHVLGKLGFPAVHPLLTTTQTEHELRVTTLDRGIDAHAWDTGTPTIQPRLFTDGLELTDWVTAAVRSFGPTGDPDRFAVVDLEKCGTNTFAHLPTWRATLGTPWGNWVVDGVYATHDGFYEWRHLGYTHADGRPRK